jgi:hypothetical protein
MSDPTKRVKCASHGETPATFVCVHLVHGVACGFHFDDDNDGDAWPDAWCDACQAAFEKIGEWNASNEPNISLMCTHCYERARAQNTEIPVDLLSGNVAVTHDQFAELADQCCERSQKRQTLAIERWGFTQKKRWDYDHDRAVISFSDSLDGPQLVADALIVGSFSTRTNTWMWSWGNDEYEPERRALTQPLKSFGDVRGIEKFATVHWPAEEVDGWEVTQIAAELLGADAVYRAPIEHLLMFFLLRNFRVEPVLH